MDDIDLIILAMHRAVNRRSSMSLDEVTALFMSEVEHIFVAPEFDLHNLME